MSDVTTCFNSLKKVVQELHSMSATDGSLQMAQPSVKCVKFPTDSRDGALILHIQSLNVDFGSRSSHGLRNGL